MQGKTLILSPIQLIALGRISKEMEWFMREKQMGKSKFQMEKILENESFYYMLIVAFTVYLWEATRHHPYNVVILLCNHQAKHEKQTNMLNYRSMKQIYLTSHQFQPYYSYISVDQLFILLFLYRCLNFPVWLLFVLSSSIYVSKVRYYDSSMLLVDYFAT